MRVAILLLALAAVAAARELTGAVEPAILNGKDAPKDRFNYIASLRWPWATRPGSRKGQFKCSGVLIAPDVVLTVASCVMPSGLYPEVRLGGWERNGGTFEKFAVTRTIWNADYMPGDLSADVALMLLDGESKYRPVNAPKSQPDPAVMVGTKLTIAGWGATSGDYDATDAPNLKMASLLLMSQDKCEQIWPFLDGFNTKRAICGRYDGHVKALCWGDMGAPMIKTGASAQFDKVVGIGSYTQCTAEGSVFTNAARNSYWISEGLKVIKGKPSANEAKYIVRDFPEPL